MINEKFETTSFLQLKGGMGLNQEYNFLIAPLVHIYYNDTIFMLFFVFLVQTM